MITAGVRRFFLPAILCAVFATPPPMAMAAQSGKSGAYNLYKEATAGKKPIVWRDAPANAIPESVCSLLEICGGRTKFIVLPPADEGGLRVGRGMFLTETTGGKHTPALVLERQTISDIYFMVVSPANGSLEKAAYRELGKQWVVIANVLARPTFNKEKQVWHEHLVKLGVA